MKTKFIIISSYHLVTNVTHSTVGVQFSLQLFLLCFYDMHKYAMCSSYRRTVYESRGKIPMLVAYYFLFYIDL